MPAWTLKFEVAFDTDPADEPGGGDWTDLSARLRSKQAITVALGAGRLAGISQGSCTLTLDNADRAIDPTNAAATYNLVPLRHARLTATIDATTYPLFRGLIDAWPPAWTGFDSWVSIRMVDGFAWLALQDADLDLPKQMSHDRITAILDLADWPTELRDIDDGVVQLEAHEQNSANLFRSLVDAADAEGGELYVAPDGKITFRSRHNRFDGVSALTIGEGGTAFSAANPAWDTAWLTNIARVELEDGRVYETIDDTSVTAYGPRVMPTRDLALREAEAVAVAQWEVYRFAEPHLWLDQVLVEDAECDAIEAVLPLRVGDLLTVAHTPPAGDPVSVQLSVERVVHTISDVRWNTSLDLAPYFGAGPWMVWDDDTRGWDMDALWAP